MMPGQLQEYRYTGALHWTQILLHLLLKTGR